jgi:hypothetical protein
MIQKIKTLIMMAILPFAMGAPLALAVSPIAASAACSGIADNVTKGVNDSVEGGAAGAQCGDKTGLNDNSIGAIAKKVVTILSQIVGFISVVFIIIGGFRYITSGGDSGKVGAAKNTIIYALVGLIIVALAQTIIHFVLNTSSTVVTP